jgi:hypothetical protein
VRLPDIITGLFKKVKYSTALDLFTSPITDNITIHLKESTTASYKGSGNKQPLFSLSARSISK